MFDFSVLGTFFVTKSELCLVFSKAIKYPDFCGFVTRAFNYQRSSFFQHSSKNQTQNRFRNKKLAQNGKIKHKPENETDYQPLIDLPQEIDHSAPKINRSTGNSPRAERTDDYKTPSVKYGSIA